MSEDTIIITTESVKVEELQGREKQIYDYAYKKGYDAGKNRNLDRKKEIIFLLMLICVLLALTASSIWGPLHHKR